MRNTKKKMSDEELIKQADALFEQNKFEEAKRIYYEILPKYPSTDYLYVFLRVNLAEILQDQGCYDEAEKVLEEAIAVQTGVFGKFNEQTVSLLHQLGKLYEEANKHDLALFLYLQALDISKQLNPNGRSMVDSLNNLGTLYRIQGDFQKSESSILQAHAILQSTFETNPESIAPVLNNLMVCYMDQRQFDKAETIYKRITDLQNAEHYQDFAQSNLAKLYHFKGEHDLAEKNMIHLLQRHEQQGKPELQIADVCIDLGTIYFWHHKFDQAKVYLERAKNTYLQLLDQTHQQVQLCEAILVDVNNMIEKCCSICQKPSKLICSQCKRAYFCSPAHQKQGWKAHKLKCQDTCYL